MDWGRHIPLSYKGVGGKAGKKSEATTSHKFMMQPILSLSDSSWVAQTFTKLEFITRIYKKMSITFKFQT